MSTPREAVFKYQTKSESDPIPPILTYHWYLRPVIPNIFRPRPKILSKSKHNDPCPYKRYVLFKSENIYISDNV